ncbi:glutamate--tRNA ligase [Elasticomyces elasticus]|nr:glutamate--tRNA ligase [Elasticomyces elasticus]
MTEAHVKEWHTRAEAFKSLNLRAIEEPLAELDAHLTLRSYIVGYSVTDADTIVWNVLRDNRVAHAYIKQGLMVNLSRWFKFIEETASPREGHLPDRTKQEQQQQPKEDAGASYDIGLQDTSKGVVTRFPPEPSGYLHIGHAKAALLNDYFAHKKYKGTMILRFDDTNPSKEKQEYQDSIVEDLALMGITPDKTTYTSDYFQELSDYCIKMIKSGKAYADDSTKVEIKQQRDDRVASKHRDDSIEGNLARFEEMKTGSEEGKRWSIRAKISVDDPNGALRDPVIYRCNDQPHHRTGSTWKIYPTYDFACPIVDSVEKVTHALRTTEYNDRDAQYQWMIKALDIPGVFNWNFARMNFIRTLLSKRKLTKLVERGVVWGWDDPRMPTVRGVRRRGMTIPALQDFILKQGPSKNIVYMDWAAIWATNKKFIDPIAKRYTAVDSKDKVVCTVIGAREGAHSEQKPVHAKNADLGTKAVWYSKEIIIDQADAQSFAADEEITLMNWGNAIVRNVSKSLNPLALLPGNTQNITGVELELHLQGDVKKTSKKITWLSTSQELVPVTLVEFDYLLKKDKLTEEEDDNFDALFNTLVNTDSEHRTEALADCNVAELKENDIIQFDRKGFYRIDKAFKAGKPAVAFLIPTGKGQASK